VSLDLYGLNNYEWKGDATIAAYSGINQAFAEYNIPAYFSEFGSNAVSPRPFTEVAALFSSAMTDIWSGGLAFGYFQSVQTGFGLVDISSDGSTVTPNQDFTNLQNQYSQVVFVNTPDQTTAGATAFPACAAPDGVNFLGSNNLPPTPDQAACDCAVNSAFSCVFSPQTSNVSAIEGTLFNFTCGQLGSLGLNSCDSLSASGATGTYGLLASCDPATQLSFAFSALYEANSRNPQACSFSGNATVNPAAPSTATAAEAAASSCLAPATTTFTPTGPAAPAATHAGGSSTGGSGSPSGSGTAGSGSGGNAAGRSSGDVQTLFGMSFAVAATVALGTLLVAV